MNQKLVKRIFYFLFFLALWALIIFGFYFVFKSQPTCFDGKRNQGEEGIDCGGPCFKVCLSPNFKEIEIKDVKFKNINNKLILLAKIQNNNPHLASWQFDYNFNVFDENNNLIKNIIGQSFIYAEEIKYIEEVLDDNFKNIQRVNFEILNPIWVKADDFVRPKLNFVDKSFSKKNGFIYVGGKIINNDFIFFKDIKIIANFYDVGGFWLGSSKTKIENINSGEIKEFEINFPADDFDLNKIQAEIVIEAKRT